MEDDLLKKYDDTNNPTPSMRRDDTMMYGYDSQEHPMNQFDGLLHEFESMLQNLFGEMHINKLPLPNSESIEGS